MRGATKSHTPIINLKLISIHTPHVGSDDSPAGFGYVDIIFQSTLPMWGATLITATGESRTQISIHTPHVGSDVEGLPEQMRPMIFQSTLPMWGATGSLEKCIAKYRDFNPHSPCGERLRLLPLRSLPYHFNPHSPCGERLVDYSQFNNLVDFNPHSPCGERPSDSSFWAAMPLIFQSTLPMWGATLFLIQQCRFHRQFQSTLPMWGATLQLLLRRQQ